jgi:uncharacterized membrane protein
MSATLHPFEIALFRNLFALVVVLPWFYRYGIGPLRTQRFGLHVLRALFNIVAMLAFFYAVSVAPLSEVTALGFSSPIFATVLAALVLGEVVRPRRWAAIAIGFVGALIILRPGFASIGLGQMLALLSALAGDFRRPSSGRPAISAWARRGPAPGHGLDQRDALCQLWIAGERLGERGVDLGELAVEQRQGGLDLLPQQRFGDARQAVGLLAFEPEQLATAGAQRGEARLLGSRRRARLRSGEFAVAGQRAGIDAIGFGEPAQAGGEGAHAAWIDHAAGQAGRRQGVGHRAFQTAAGFEDDPLGAGRLRATDQLGQFGRVGAHREALLAWSEVDIEAILGDIDADPARSLS